MVPASVVSVPEFMLLVGFGRFLRKNRYSFGFGLADVAICCRPSICQSSVMLVHPTQAVENFTIFLWHLVPWPSVGIHIKFYGDRPRGTPLPGKLNTRGSQI